MLKGIRMHSFIFEPRDGFHTSQTREARGRPEVTVDGRATRIRPVKYPGVNLRILEKLSLFSAFVSPKSQSYQVQAVHVRLKLKATRAVHVSCLSALAIRRELCKG